jgi:signal transduction histidine kinase
MFLVIYPSFISLLIESTKESALRAASHLKSEVFIDNAEINKEALKSDFLNKVDTIKKDLDLEKLKIFSKSGEIIFSSDPKDIGNINEEKYFHEIVAAGNVFTQVIQKNTETLEGQIVTSDVVETYVPVMNAGVFRGAFEIYYDITSEKEHLDRLLSHSFILLLILPAGLLFIVIAILFKENIALTGRKRAEEALQKAHQELKIKAAELKEANSELSQYTRVVSHDLQAPHRAINNYVSFLREDLRSTLKDEHKEYLDALSRTVNEANDMVQGLLKLSRIGKNTISFTKIHTGTFLKELINSLSLPAAVKIKFTMVEDWPSVETDSVLLRQIFQNLIENAVKFSKPQNRLIEFGWQKGAGESYEFLVSDNGIGIEQRYHEKIFQVFERLHTSKEYEGSGSGLAIVKKSVSKLSGSIRVESTIGQGSTFFVTLPKTQGKR